METEWLMDGFVVVNRNGELKLVIMAKDTFNEYFRIRKPNGEKDIEKEYFGTDIQNCETEAIMIRKLKNPAEIVKLCESANKPFPIIRNGYDELYVMSYKEYLRRKGIITVIDIIQLENYRCFEKTQIKLKKIAVFVEKNKN